MLKMTRLPNLPAFRKNNGNSKVVDFDISGSNSDGGKAS